MDGAIDLEIMWQPRRTCRLCTSTDLQLVVPMEDIPQGDAYVSPEGHATTVKLYPHGLNFCNDCGHVQTTIDVNQSLIYRNYIWTTGISPGLSASYAQYADALVKRFVPEGRGFAVEIGGNDGTFARHLQSTGLTVLAVEPATNLASRLRESGTETIAEFFTESLARGIAQDHGQADLIVANHVFANINDNDEITAGIKVLLKPGGVLSVQVFYLYDVMQSMLLENMNHEHPSYMYVRSLARYFDRHGLELFDVQRVDTKGGSIRCFVQHKGAGKPVSDTVGAFILREEQMGLHKAETYQLLQRHIEVTRAAFADSLTPFRAGGTLIGAYGTSIGATVFTYQYHLGDYLDFFVDDDPARHGLVSPGFGIPVLPPSALYDRKPGLVVITAPLYADAIISRHQKFLEYGGKFLVFRPSFKIILSR